MNGDLVILVSHAVLGAIFGVVADVLARRWPGHEDDYARRGPDWRTVLVMVTGAGVFGLLGLRYLADPQTYLIYALLFLALLLLLATDLDQRVLPDLVTLPMIVFAAALLVLNWSPALADKDLGRISGVVAGILAPVLLFISSRVLGGGLGMGDVKLSVSLGLIFGLSALFYGLLAASIGFAVVLLVLIATRRLGLKSFVPFGPVLIFAAFIAALAT